MDTSNEWFRWIGRLGALNQCRDVDYVEKKGSSVRCLLCKTGWMRSTGRMAHFKGNNHEQQYNQVVRETKKNQRAMIRDSMLEQYYSDKKVNSITHLKWKADVMSQLLEVIKDPDYPLAVLFDEEFSKTVEKYVRMEVTSLLEEVLWKANICNSGLFSSVREVKEYSILEEGFDFKDFLKIKKITCGSEIVIPQVIAYLGWNRIDKRWYGIRIFESH